MGQVGSGYAVQAEAATKQQQQRSDERIKELSRELLVPHLSSIVNPTRSGIPHGVVDDRIEEL